MKKHSCIQLLCVLFSMTVNAQPAPVVIKETPKKGETKTTTIKNDGLGTETKTVEYHKDGPPPKLELKVETTKNLLTGDSTKVVTSYHDGYGEREKNVTTITYQGGRTVIYSYKKYHRNGALDKDNSWAVQPDGSVKIQKLNPKTGEYETTVKTKEEMQPFDSLKYTKSGRLIGMNQPDQKNCNPKIEIFGGYSYLNSSFGDDRESFSLGGHVSFNYNITPHLGAGFDASLHTKKDGDFTLTRGFILIDGMYTLGDINNCYRKLIPDVHLLAGLACEKQKYSSGSITSKSSGSGFAFGGGTGVDIKFTENGGSRLALRTQADFIGVKFKNSDKLNTNIRISLGASLALGAKYDLNKRIKKYYQ